MKSNKKFPPELRAIVGQALTDKSAWIGERGVFQEEIKRLEKEIARLKADQARDDRAKERFLKRMEDKDV